MHNPQAGRAHADPRQLQLCLRIIRCRHYNEYACCIRTHSSFLVFQSSPVQRGGLQLLMCSLPRIARQPALREPLQIIGGIFWLLLATGLQSSVSGAGLAWNRHCGQLASGNPRDLCNNYYLASNALERVCAAHSWRELERATCKPSSCRVQLRPPAPCSERYSLHL